MQKCKRCIVSTNVTTMSRFNTDILCTDCERDERILPTYANAAAVELKAVQNGNMNYPGIGLSAADRKKLARLVQLRPVDTGRFALP